MTSTQIGQDLINTLGESAEVQTTQLRHGGENKDVGGAPTTIITQKKSDTIQGVYESAENFLMLNKNH